MANRLLVRAGQEEDQDGSEEEDEDEMRCQDLEVRRPTTGGGQTAPLAERGGRGVGAGGGRGGAVAGGAGAGGRGGAGGSGRGGQHIVGRGGGKGQLQQHQGRGTSARPLPSPAQSSLDRKYSESLQGLRMLVTERQRQEGSVAHEHEETDGPFFEYLTRTADGFLHRGTVFIP